jgi:hypothetical protein
METLHVLATQGDSDAELKNTIIASMVEQKNHPMDAPINHLDDNEVETEKRSAVDEADVNLSRVFVEEPENEAEAEKRSALDEADVNSSKVFVEDSDNEVETENEEIRRSALDESDVEYVNLSNVFRDRLLQLKADIMAGLSTENVELPCVRITLPEITMEHEIGGCVIPATGGDLATSTDVEALAESEIVAEQATILADLVEKRLTDQKNTELLVKLSKGHLLHWFDGNKWFAFDGKRWVMANNRPHQLAKQVARNFLDKVPGVSDKKYAKEISAHAIYSESSYGISAMVNNARSEADVQITMEEFDTDKSLFNLNDGTINLNEWTFREHRPAGVKPFLS